MSGPLNPILVTVAAEAEDDIFSLWPPLAAAAARYAEQVSVGAYQVTTAPKIVEVGLGSAEANDAAAMACAKARQEGHWVLVRLSLIHI